MHLLLEGARVGQGIVQHDATNPMLHCGDGLRSSIVRYSAKHNFGLIRKEKPFPKVSSRLYHYKM